MKAGDTVQLKSGGPTMTIREVIDGETAVCNWFWQGKPQMETYPVGSLREVNVKTTESVSFREMPDID